MKKREKFLLAFLISFVVIMGRYVVVKTKEAIHEGLKGKAEYEWLFKNNDWSYENLTEDAKQYFEQEVQDEKEEEKQNEIEEQKYCTEYPEGCTESKEHERNIYSKAMDYFVNNIADKEEYFNTATAYDITIFRILWLTLIIYSVLALELKNKKQYFIDNIKLLLIIVLFITLGNGLITLHEYIIRYNSYIYYSNDYIFIGYVSEIVGMSLVTYIVILIPNLIYNIIKKKRQNKINKSANTD